jgi:hypothetical protein
MKNWNKYHSEEILTTKKENDKRKGRAKTKIKQSQRTIVHKARERQKTEKAPD